MVKVRSADAADRNAIIACDDYSPQHPERQVRIEKGLLAGECLVAEDAGEVIGYLLAKPDFFDFEFVDVLMVHPAHRRKGVGRALLLAAIDRCESRQLFTSANASSDQAVRLFSRVGFKPCGQIDELNPDEAELIFRVDCIPANIRNAQQD